MTVVAGETKTCMITNNDNTAHLKLVKTVTNDNGGTAVADRLDADGGWNRSTTPAPAASSWT